VLVINDPSTWGDWTDLEDEGFETVQLAWGTWGREDKPPRQPPPPPPLQQLHNSGAPASPTMMGMSTPAPAPAPPWQGLPLVHLSNPPELHFSLKPFNHPPYPTKSYNIEQKVDECTPLRLGR
jgi:hypothetical protein